MQNSITTKTMTCDVCGLVQESTGSKNTFVTRSIGVRGPGVIDSEEIEMCMTCWMECIAHSQPFADAQLTKIFLGKMRNVLVTHLHGWLGKS